MQKSSVACTREAGGVLFPLCCEIAMEAAGESFFLVEADQMF